MGVREDCRHYLHRSTPRGEVVQRCRISMASESPFGCPDGCLFFEPRPYSGAGWVQAPAERMPNTADGLNALPPQKKRRNRKKR